MTREQHDVPSKKKEAQFSGRVFSSEKLETDYTTVKGIHQRTGVSKKDLPAFILKELLDNAVDFIEKYGGSAEHLVKVTLRKRKIVIANSNFGMEPFTRELLKSIFSFDRFYGEKRNVFRISRGYLGDAFKEILCVPYALGLSERIENWNQSLTISGNRISHSVRLEINRVEQTIIPVIQTKNKIANNGNITTIDVPYPETKDGNEQDLVNILIQYCILNPHISFDIDIDLENNTEGLYGKYKKLLNQTQKMNSEWPNRPSVHYYSLDEFNQLINGLVDNDSKYTIYYLC